MKITITLKDPDGVYEQVRDAVHSQADGVFGLDEDERELVCDNRLEETWKKLGKWIRHKEYITVEIDIDAGTAIVVPRR